MPGFRVLLTVILTCLAGTPAHAQDGLKVFISADMEGVVGVVTGDQLGPGGFEYGRFREFMTREVLAAIDGARAAGATDIVVADSHGNGENLLLEMLPSDITLVRAWPRPNGMMQGVDASFDAALLIGYHSGTTNPEGVRAHTLSSARLADVRLNDRSALEAGISAAIAGHYGVPIVMISGDDATVAEATAFIGDIEGAVVKWNYGFHSARTVMPDSAYTLIRDAAERGVRRADDIAPVRMSGPVALDIRFKNYRPSEILSYLTIVERTSSHTIRFVGDDMLEVSRFLQFISHFDSGATP